MIAWVFLPTDDSPESPWEAPGWLALHVVLASAAFGLMVLLGVGLAQAFNRDTAAATPFWSGAFLVLTLIVWVVIWFFAVASIAVWYEAVPRRPLRHQLMIFGGVAIGVATLACVLVVTAYPPFPH
jgi:hypothetical protein